MAAIAVQVAVMAAGQKAQGFTVSENIYANLKTVNILLSKHTSEVAKTLVLFKKIIK